LDALYHSDKMSPFDIIAAMTCNPALVLGRAGAGIGTLTVGARADVTIIDPYIKWTVTDDFMSKSSNSPFIGMKLRGRVISTIFEGREVYKYE